MAQQKINIVEGTYSLGLGGTEYVIQLFCKYFDKELFDVTVVCINTGGERVEIIEKLGCKVIILNKDLSLLGPMLEKADVFHWHGAGTVDPAVFSIVKKNKPRLVLQTNVFGYYIDSPYYQLLDYDLYVSQMILIRRIKHDQFNELFLSKRKVLHNPVDYDELNRLTPSVDTLIEFKKANSLQDYFVVGRIGRADDVKFDLIAMEGFAHFIQINKNARFLLVGATPYILDYAKQLHITEYLLIFDNTPDLQQLVTYYKCMDVFIAASNIGESFGMVIAEAMSLAVPVLTISTENNDNAQIELVDNNVTGLVVKHDSEMVTSALNHLYENPDLRRKFGANAQKKVAEAYHAKKIAYSLQHLILSHLYKRYTPKYRSLLLDYSIQMKDDYERRCGDLWP